MLIVSDTSPLRYLVEVGVIDALPRLYGTVMTTPQIMAELQQEHFPEVVRRWAEQPPKWLTIESPVQIRFADQLDDGEASALTLALERRADVLLVDERLATGVARNCGLKTAGTLAVLLDAGHAGLIDFHAAIMRLTTQTAFHYTKELITAVIASFETESRRRKAERNT